MAFTRISPYICSIATETSSPETNVTLILNHCNIVLTKTGTGRSILLSKTRISINWRCYLGWSNNLFQNSGEFFTLNLLFEEIPVFPEPDEISIAKLKNVTFSRIVVVGIIPLLLSLLSYQPILPIICVPERFNFRKRVHFCPANSFYGKLKPFHLCDILLGALGYTGQLTHMANIV